MSVFGSILNQVMASSAQIAQTAGATPQDNSASALGDSLGGEPVDVEAVLDQKLRDKGNPGLNWRMSIVDLMKLLDIDSSLDNRKELATELGYEGEKNGSAEMNIWLHRKVMQGLAENGGRVPAGMAD